MTIQDLRYLVAVADHLHFGKAAGACYISQPTLSMQIKKLEQELGIQLIERTNKKVIITAMGNDVVHRARIILKEQKEIIQMAKQYQMPYTGTVTFGIIPTMAPYLLPRVMPVLYKAFPKLKFLLVEEQTQKITEKLASGELDALILALPVDLDNVRTSVLSKEEFLLAVHPSHHLAKRKFIQQKELKDETLLLLEEGHCLRDQVLEVCSYAGAKENTGFRATSLETLRYMVAANTGMTLMPKMAKVATGPNVVYIPFRKPKPERIIGMVWRNTSSMAGVLETIRDKIKSILPK